MPKFAMTPLAFVKSPPPVALMAVTEQLWLSLARSQAVSTACANWFVQSAHFGANVTRSRARPSGPGLLVEYTNDARATDGFVFATLTMKWGGVSAPLCAPSQRNWLPSTAIPVLQPPGVVGTGKVPRTTGPGVVAVW